jgi:glycosyltransferase involved in cell wall biosynthesis
MFGGKHLKANARHIINGYSEADFSGLEPCRDNDGKFVLLYTGSFYLKQSPQTFLKAFAGFKERHREKYDNTLFRFVGVSHDIDIAESARDLGIADRVQILGRLPHGETLTEMISAGALLLIVAKSPQYSTVYTGKFFEYLRAGKPILLIGQKNSVVADLLAGHEGCRTVDADNREGIVAALAGMYDRWAAGKGCDHADMAARIEGERTSAAFAELVR